MSASQAKPVVAIVGAGRVGRALGRRLHQRGWPIGAVVTRSLRTARAAVRAIGAGNPSDRLDASVLDADLILIATPDVAIPSVARQLAAFSGAPPFVSKGGGFDLSSRGKIVLHTRGALNRAVLRLNHRGTATKSNSDRAAVTRKDASLSKRGGFDLAQPWRGKIVLHTCGALDRAVLRPMERRGAATGALHPLQTFSGQHLPNLDGCACAIDGNPAAMACARRICRELGCIPIRVPRNSRAAYHAAAVLAAGHVLAAVEAAARILMALGFSRRKAIKTLLPLTRQTLSNFERSGGPRSWTGPASRGDLQTIRKHLSALRRFPREYREAYAALTRLGVLLLARQPRAARKRLQTALRG